MWFHENAKIIDYIKYFTKRKGIRVGLCPATITDYSFILDTDIKVHEFNKY